MKTSAIAESLPLKVIQMKNISFVVILVFGLNIAPIHAQKTSESADLPDFGRAPMFENGQTICFLGDSITQGALYQTVIEYFYATRYPDRAITFWNCGIAGDTAQSILGTEAYRLQTDVLGHKPDLVVVMLGMNDVNRGLYKPIKTASPDNRNAAREAALQNYRDNMGAIFDKIQDFGSNLILLTPTIYEESPNVTGDDGLILKGVNAALGICAEWVRAEASRRETGWVDFHAVLGELNAREQAAQKDFSLLKLGRTSGLDRVHPYMPGHWIMAYLFLKAQGHLPVVSQIEINAETGDAGRTFRSEVEDIRATSDTVSFDYTSEALPFAVAENGVAALQVIPLVEELSQEIISLQRLTPGHYELSIDNRIVGTFSDAEFADGINLGGNDKTPQYQQALKVYRLAADRSRLGARIRSGVAARYAAAKYEKIDPMDEAAIERSILNRIEQVEATGGNTTSLKVALEAVRSREKLDQDYEKLGKLMRDAAIPIKRQYALIKTQP